MSRINKFFYILLFSVGILISSDVFSQNSSSSPYSRYGLGDLLFSGFSKNLGMGGIGQGVNHSLNLNPLNPASYSTLWLTTYEAGVNMTFQELATTKLTQNTNTSSLAYFAFGFPVKSKKWGMGFGLLPYSNVGYSEKEVRTDNLFVPETHTYEGSGGLNQFYLTNGFSLAKNFSAGVTASYLFGVLNQDRKVEFSDLSYFNTNISHSNSLGWFHFNFGLQYTFDSLRIAPSDSLRSIDKQLKENRDSIRTLDKSIATLSEGEEKTKLLNQRILLDSLMNIGRTNRASVKSRLTKSDWDLTFGFTIAPGTDLRARQSVLAYNFKYLTEDKDQIIIRDTISDTHSAEGKVHLPLSAGLGFTMKKGNRWLFGSDFSIQQWSDFTSFGIADSLVDSWKVSLGGQFTPNDRAIKAYWKQIQYRLGLHYAKSFLELNNTHIDEMGLALGFGFPIRRAGTTVQLTAEAGKRGTTKNNLIEENYYRFTLGFSLNDRWFIKPKYD